jgi:hypothetical protein
VPTLWNENVCEPLGDVPAFRRVGDAVWLTAGPTEGVPTRLRVRHFRPEPEWSAQGSDGVMMWHTADLEYGDTYTLADLQQNTDMEQVSCKWGSARLPPDVPRRSSAVARTWRRRLMKMDGCAVPSRWWYRGRLSDGCIGDVDTGWCERRESRKGSEWVNTRRRVRRSAGGPRGCLVETASGRPSSIPVEPPSPAPRSDS